MSKVVISLTTIPDRMGDISKTLESLVNQSAQIDEVLLWIPRTYRRGDISDFTIPEFPKGITIKRIENDYGPATKILPALKAYEGEDVTIIYCDDDRIYDEDWAEKMLSAARKHPGDCIAEAGEVIESLQRKFRATFLKNRILKYITFGVTSHFHRKKIRELNPGIGIVDVCKGYGGVLVKPDYFTPSVFDIPDVMWTVDDIWLSGNLTANGITIRQITAVENSIKDDTAFVAPLFTFVYKDHSREKANMLCIKYFQDKFQVWL